MAHKLLGVAPSGLNDAARKADMAPLPLLPSGAVAETMHRGLINSLTMPGASSGTLRMVAIGLRRGDVINSITFLAGSTAGTGLTRVWFALYDGSLVKRGVTSEDNAATWTANTAKTLSLSSPYTVTVSGVHYLGLVVTGTTAPTLMGFGSSSTVTTGLAPIITGTSTTGLTTAASAPDPAGAITAVSQFPYAYAS